MRVSCLRPIQTTSGESSLRAPEGVMSQTHLIRVESPIGSKVSSPSIAWVEIYWALISKV